MKKDHKLIFIIILVTLLITAIVFAPLFDLFKSNSSFYIPSINFIYCNNARDCRHEIGHQMSNDLNNISHSTEFNLAAITYAFARANNKDEISNIVFNSFFYNNEYRLFGKRMFSSPQDEIYASIYAEAEGDISKLPYSLQSFYSEDQSYIDLYNCLLSDVIKLCNRSIYIKK